MIQVDRRALLALLALTIVGCKDDKPAAEGAGGAPTAAAGKAGAPKLDPGQEFVYEGAQRDLAEIKANLGKPDFDPKYDCVSVNQAVTDLATVDNAEVKAFLVEGEKMCGLDAWVAYGNLYVKKMEEERAKEPEKIFSSECAYLGLAIDGVSEKHKGDPQVAALVEKQKTLCP